MLRETTEPSEAPLRWEFKHEPSSTGYVDGAWWPRSRNLSAELPALVEMLAAQSGPPKRVSFNLAAWDQAPRRLHTDGRTVRLAGFHSQCPNTLDVWTDRRRITLLVVPLDTSPSMAKQMMIRASRPGNQESVEELLTPSAATTAMPTSDGSMDAAMQRWEADGGNTYEHAHPRGRP